MSIEMYVFFRGKLPSKTALTKAMKELGFPFTIKPATGPLEKQHGYMPMLLRREETGVEFDVYDDPSVLAEFADEGIDPSLDRMASFRWAGDRQEMVAGMCCAAALARLVDGIVFDAEEGKLRSVGEAIAFAKSHLEAISKPEDARRPGTRPADIKRYLKPLLKLRPDLALVGRRLIIRPVRHLLRGAFLDRTGDKYSFRVWRYIQPLYAGARGVGYGDYIHAPVWRVYEPYFEPLLLDVLSEDIFDDLGQMTTLADFSRELVRTGKREIPDVTDLLLSGERESAIALVNEIERSKAADGKWQRWVDWARGTLAVDIETICAEYRIKEAETAKEMRLGDIWKPSPFGAELGGANRHARSSEPCLATTPWISRPADLYQDLPEHPGEVRFAKRWLNRKGEVKLLTPLTPDQAQEERRKYEHHVLAARLACGQLLCLCYDAGRNSRRPDQPKGVTDPPAVTTFHLWVFGSSGVIFADFTTFDSPPGILTLSSLEACRKETLARIWSWSPDVKEGVRRSWDDRADERIFTKGELTEESLLLCAFPMPAFLEYEEFWQRARTLLESEGFGTFT